MSIMNMIDREFLEYIVPNGGYKPYTQQVLRFENGYGASIISDGYGSESGLLELAVILWIKTGPNEEYKFNICYDTPLTENVLGFLTCEEVNQYLKMIKNLPEKENENAG